MCGTENRLYIHMKSFKKIVFLLMVLGAQKAFAQQEFMVTHYMFNGLALNPAYAGVHEGISLSFLYRNQWVGFEGAPNTQLASIHSPINGRPISLGAIFFRDELGLSTEHGGYFSYAYRIQVDMNLKLSMGLQFSTHNYQIKYSRAENGVFDPGDNLADINEFKWNFGSGLMLHNDRFFIGVSVPQILDRKLDVNDPDGNFSKLIRHYYGYIGYAFNINQDLILKPNVLVKSVENAPVQIDLNANALIKNILWVGISYRSLDSIDGIVGFQITPQMQFSYATDFTLTEINNQSHEVMLNYVFSFPTKKILTPRYF